MNVPGMPEGNWIWKLAPDDLNPERPELREVAEYFRSLAEESQR